MQRVSEFLQSQHPEPVSRNTIEENVKGKSRDWIRKAIDQLIAEEYAMETRGHATLEWSPTPSRSSPRPVRPTSPPPRRARTARTSPSSPAPKGANLRADELELDRLQAIGEEMGLA